MKNKRSIENTLIQPREQLKVILVFVGTAVVFLAIFTVAFIFTMNSTLQEISGLSESTPAIMRSLEKSLALSIYVTISIAVLLSIVLVIAGFALSHRLYGPTVQIKRLMHRLALGDYKARGQPQWVGYLPNRHPLIYALGNLQVS